MKPKKIINNPDHAVAEFVQGLLYQFPSSLVKLQNHNVLFKAIRPSQVQILSGGGSGHEPSHAGWIGEGMLTGAILGGIFASPSVSSILAAIRVASAGGKDPVLLIVKNYTGDRLNFGMACEKANMEGIDCQMVLIADDCALERTKGITGARGVAGTVLVHKIAGAAAASGRTLSEVIDVVKLACRHMGTLGVALDAVTVPGALEVNNRLDDDNTIEIGLGIHGEAGMQQSVLLNADDIAKKILQTIQDYGREDENDLRVPMIASGDDVCLLVNNLGGTSNFEMSILAQSAVKILEEQYQCRVCRLLVGSFMTSFNMHGASLTILNLKDFLDLKDLLDAKTSAPAWTAVEIFHESVRPSFFEVPEIDHHEAFSENKVIKPPLDDFWSEVDSKLKRAAVALAAAESQLTQYDTIVGDGDCGITMKRGAEKVLEGGISTTHPVTLFASLADAISASMGGTSGVLLELMFRKMSSTLSRETNIGPKEVAQAFAAGVQAISYYGGATVGARTMLDALVPAAEALCSMSSLKEAAAQARSGAESTALMKSASAGRSNYLSETVLDGTPDPGAMAVAIVLEALADSAP
jgi:triose/dihydroxyacetone kinase / FAD-AMP lyase (cyclizing)